MLSQRCGFCWALLPLALPLLQLLHDLLRSAHGNGRRGAVLSRLRFLLGLRFLRRLVCVRVLVVGWGRRFVCSVLDAGASGARSQHNPARRTLAAIANHQYVVAGAVEKLRDHIAGGPRAISAKNSLIVAHPFNLDAGLEGNFFQDLRQA